MSRENTRTNRYAINKYSEKKVDKVNVFIFDKSMIYGIEYITFGIAIDELRNHIIKNALKTNKAFIEIYDGIEVPDESILVYGVTDDVPIEIAEELSVERMWHYSFANMKERIVKTRNGNALRTEYFDPRDIIDIGIAMLGNPKYMVVCKVKLSRYKSLKINEKII